MMLTSNESQISDRLFKTLPALLVLAIISTASLRTFAETSSFYVGLSYTSSDIDIDSPIGDENISSNSEGLLIGYRFIDWLAIELAYQPASDTEITLIEDNDSGYQTSYKASYDFKTSLSLVAEYNFSSAWENWAILGKLGAMRAKSEININETLDTYWTLNGERIEGEPLTDEEINNLDFTNQEDFESFIRAYDQYETARDVNSQSDNNSEIIPIISAGFRYTCRRESFICPSWLIDQLGFSFDASYFKLEPELLNEKHELKVAQQSLGLQWYFN